MSSIQKMFQDARFYIRLAILNETPTIVYAPGRVGSVSLLLALRKSDVLSFKVERLENESLSSVRLCKKHIFTTNRPAKIITLVRDPVEILCSFFFSKSGRGHLPSGQAALKNKDISAMKEAFVSEILDSDFLDYFLNWYEEEFQKNTDVTVYAAPFNTAQGHTTIQHDFYPTLILRTDLPDNKKEQAISDFLHLNTLHLEKINVKNDRPNGEFYTQFKQELEIEPVWVNKIYTSTYAKHFFSAVEIDTLQKRWLKK